MSKKIEINSLIQTQMGEEWRIEVSEKPFTEGKGANLPAWGYPCAVCGSKDTKLCFAENTDEEKSVLIWMELQCKSCKNYTLYDKKETAE